MPVPLRTCAVLVLSAFAAAGAQAKTALYTRMGGEKVVTAVVDDTIDRVVADHRLGRSFDGANIARIKRLLAEQICDLAGGGCHYSGDPMKEVHAGHHISEAEFYGLVELLRSSLARHHVALAERNELLALLAPMERDVVEERSATSREAVKP